MNELCKCDGAFCSRHQIAKTARERELCSGQAATADRGMKYWDAWEQGRLGATAPELPAISPPGFRGGLPKPVKAVSSIGTRLHAIIHRETGAEIPCPECAAAISKLDSMTPAEAVQAKPELVTDIIARGITKAPKLLDRLLLRADQAISRPLNAIIAATGQTTETSQAVRIVGAWIDEAIREGTEPIIKKPPPAHLRRNGAGVAGKGRLKPTTPIQPVPFTGDPRLTLMFHVWPHGDSWRRHIEKLEPVLHRFDHLLLGVATDVSTATLEETVAAFGDRWEVTHVVNNPEKRHGLREVATYQQMIKTLGRGVNDVTFCAHGKGAQVHNVNSEPVTWWTDAMYDTILYNIDGVINEMRNGASIVGSFRRHGRQLGTTHRWHYSGTFYAFRNATILSNGVPQYRQNWWGTESWPGDHFPLSHSACIFGDQVGDMYKANQQPRAAFEQWKANR
jgi:hypothetical protein